MTDDAYYAHCYLREIRNLNTRLEIKRLEQEDLFNKAQGCGGVGSDMKVQTSPKSDAMELAVAMLVEMKAEYEALYMVYMNKRELALEAIADVNLTVDEDSVIRLYYFHGEKDEQIGKMIHLSRTRVNQLRHKALERIGKRLFKINIASQAV